MMGGPLRWQRVLIQLPEELCTVIERFAKEAKTDPGTLSAVCLMQGFALQLADNGCQDVSDALLELAALLAQRDGATRIEHRVIRTCKAEASEHIH